MAERRKYEAARPGWKLGRKEARKDEEGNRVKTRHSEGDGRSRHFNRNMQDEGRSKGHIFKMERKRMKVMSDELFHM